MFSYGLEEELSTKSVIYLLLHLACKKLTTTHIKQIYSIKQTIEDNQERLFVKQNRAEQKRKKMWNRIKSKTPSECFKPNWMNIIRTQIKCLTPQFIRSNLQVNLLHKQPQCNIISIVDILNKIHEWVQNISKECENPILHNFTVYFELRSNINKFLHIIKDDSLSDIPDEMFAQMCARLGIYIEIIPQYNKPTSNVQIHLLDKVIITSI